VGLLAVGWIEGGRGMHGMPRAVVPLNSEVVTMDDAGVRSFHSDGAGRVRLGYYPHVVTHARQFAPQLMLAVLDQLEALGGERHSPEIAVLRRTLNWQQVFQGRPL
jgi:hypothetical protein